MPSKLPLYRQEKPKTCALACLRMVLAAFGTDLEESALEAVARMEDRGTPIEELERLARLHNLTAEIQETTLEELQHILDAGMLPIAYIDRAVFDLNPRQRAKHSLSQAKIHSVIPTHSTEGYVTVHDPLFPRVTRRSVALFAQAHRLLGNHCVVCSKPAER